MHTKQTTIIFFIIMIMIIHCTMIINFGITMCTTFWIIIKFLF